MARASSPWRSTCASPTPSATRRLRRLFEHLFGLSISEGALDALFRRAKPAFDDATSAILARLRRSRIVCSDETSVRVDGRTCWNWVFQNAQVVIHVVRNSRGAGVVAEVMGGHRPAIWVSDLFGAQQGHADLWQVCLAHQLRDCQFAIDAGDTVFAPRMKALLLRAVLLARRRTPWRPARRQQYGRRLDRDLDAIMALGPTHRHGQRLRKRYGKVRGDLFTFLIHPDAPPDNNSSERELRPTATYRKVTGGFRSAMGSRSLRQRQIRRRHGRTLRHRCLRGHPQHAMRVPKSRAGLSRYVAAFRNKHRQPV